MNPNSNNNNKSTDGLFNYYSQKYGRKKWSFKKKQLIYQNYEKHIN